MPALLFIVCRTMNIWFLIYVTFLIESTASFIIFHPFTRSALLAAKWNPSDWKKKNTRYTRRNNHTWIIRIHSPYNDVRTVYSNFPGNSLFVPQLNHHTISSLRAKQTKWILNRKSACMFYKIKRIYWQSDTIAQIEGWKAQTSSMSETVEPNVTSINR